MRHDVHSCYTYEWTAIGEERFERSLVANGAHFRHMQFFVVSPFHLRNPFRFQWWFWGHLVFTAGLLVYLNYVDVLLEL